MEKNNNCFLLADGGSTKVDWRLIQSGQPVLQVITKGANPFFRSQEDITDELKTTLVPQLQDFPVEAIYFFGAGCVSEEKNAIVRSAIAEAIPAKTIEVASDLLAAAKGLCGRNKGIVCILGTGSNSCFYDGEKIAKNVPPLGYILGDEGSGAVLGKLFLGACLKNQLSSEIKERFFAQYSFTLPELLNKVYNEPLPNRFLAGFSPFIRENLADKTVYDLLYHAFTDFFVKNVRQYDYQNNPVHFTGSVAYAYKVVLQQTAKDLNLEIGKIVSSPMDGLIEYYSFCAK
ncbi:ATPase [Bacteroidia bacterium]|nr:ATPase [Bacteroidia bacterium]